MSPRPRASSAGDHDLPDGEPASIVRRAPFADRPHVGERGQRAQGRILDAGLQVFGEVGYHGCGIKRITEVSGYSRASFYQYFSSKEDLFRHLAGRVARVLNESADALGPVTGDQAGWDALHDWLTRYSAIYDQYEAVFVTFQTAVVSDEAVASGANVVASRTFKDLRSKIVGSPRSAAQVDAVVRMLLQSVGRLNRESDLIEQAAPRSTLNRARVNIAYADLVHRAVFGPIDGVNVHTSTVPVKALTRPTPPAPEPADDGEHAHGPAALQTRAHLLEVAHRVFIERGYYATRVADVVEAAGVSHGVFYRYFQNKTDLFRLLAEHASDQLAQALDTLPELTGPPAPRAKALREWLARYASSFASEAAIFEMWSEAISREHELTDVSAAVIDDSRVRLARGLDARGWGDAEADGLVLLVLLDAMSSSIGPDRRRSSRDAKGRPPRDPMPHIEAAAEIIERGLLTGPADVTDGRARGRARGSAPRARPDRPR